MKTAVFVLGLVFFVPVMSFTDPGQENDCNNCKLCMDNKCRQCSSGYALIGIYSRRLCVDKCPGNKGMIWDSVLRSNSCDTTRACGDPEYPKNCKECLDSGSCKKCNDGFALRLRSSVTGNRIFGFNECDGTCVAYVESISGAQVCNSFQAAASSTPTPTPMPATEATDTGATDTGATDTDDTGDYPDDY